MTSRRRMRSLATEGTLDAAQETRTTRPVASPLWLARREGGRRCPLKS